MTETLLVKVFDAEPQSATQGSIRSTLLHLVTSQRGYLSFLTLPVEARPKTTLSFADLRESASASGEGLLALARDERGTLPKTRLRTREGHHVEPWVVMVQSINHATEHREQIKSMLSALGVTPPDIGEITPRAFGKDRRRHIGNRFQE